MEKTKILVFAFIFCLQFSFAQNASSLEYCSSQNITVFDLGVEEGALSYAWSNGETTPSIVYDVSVDGESVSVDVSNESPNLLINGDFESGSFDPYTSDYGSDVSNGYFSISRGFGTGTILETPVIDVTSGEDYVFLFDHAIGGAWANGTFYVEINGVKVSGDFTAGVNWTKEGNITWTAGAGVTEAVITFVNPITGQGFLGLDNLHFSTVANVVETHNYMFTEYCYTCTEVTSPDQSFCEDNASFVLQATTASGDCNNVEWFSEETGGRSLGTGCSYTTGSLTENKTYWIYDNTSEAGGCPRKPVNVSKQIEVSASLEYCANNTELEIIATVASGNCADVEWFTAEIGGTSLGTGCTYTTPPLTGDNTYWVYDNASDASCPREKVEVKEKDGSCFEICGNGYDDDGDGLIDEACETFTCDGTLYQSDGSVFSIMDTDPIKFTEFGDYGQDVNGLGYNPVDNLLYVTSFDDFSLLRIDAAGTVENLGRPSGFFQSKAGTFGADGTFYYTSGEALWSLDINTLEKTKILDFVDGDPWDIATNPTDGFIYGVAGKNLLKYDLVNNIEINLGQITGIPGGDVGAAWFTESGDLLIYGDLDNGGNQNDIARIDINTLVGNVVSNNGETLAVNDGASCPFGILMEKTVSADNVSVGGTFTYTIDIFNATGDDLTQLNFVDVLDARLEFVQLITNEFGANIITSANEVSYSGLSLPLGQTTLEFEVRVISARTCNDEELGNIASLAGLPSTFGVTILSDDPTTALQNDSTFVTINASGVISAGTISPASISQCESVAENISISGHGGTVEWQFFTDNVTWNLFTGTVVNATTITVEHTNTTTSTQTFYYRARVHSGACGEAFTAPIEVEITLGVANPPTVADVTYCHNETGVSALTATPSSGGTLKWYANNTTTTELTLAPTPNTNVVGTPAETYYVSQTIGGCESPRVALNVNIETLPVVALGNDTTICFGESITLDGGAADSYLWSTGETSQTILVDATETITLDAEIGNCDASGTITITVANEIDLDLGNDTTICFGESITLDGGTTDSYLWSTGETSQTISVDGTSSITLDVEIGTCKSSGTIEVTVADEIVLDLGNDTTICFGESITLDGGTADSYLWSTGETSQTILVDGTSIISLDVEVGTCKSSGTIEIIVADEIVLDLGNDTTICFGESITLDGGTADSYLWSTGETSQTILVDGTSIISLEVEVGTCKASGTIEIIVADEIVLDLGNDTTICFGESITLDGGTADSYLWSTGETSQTIFVDGTSIISLDVEIGTCKSSGTIEIIVADEIVLDLGNDTTICFGESITLDGGTADSYSWSTGATSQMISVDATSNITLDVEVGTCKASGTIEVTVADEIVLDLGNDKTICFGESITLDGGTADSYSWSTGATSQMISVDATSNITLDVEIGTCKSLGTIEIIVADEIVLDLGNDTTICFGESITLDGGTADSYSWSTGATSQTISVDATSSVTLDVEIGTCKASGTIEVTVADEIVLDLGNDTTICFGESITLDGGTADSYLWSTGATSQTISVDETSSITLDVEVGTCKASGAIEVTVADEIVLDLGNDTTICFGESITLDGGTADSYLWSTTETTQQIIVTNADTYTLEIEKGGCTAQGSIKVEVESLPVVSFIPSQLSAVIGTSINFTNSTTLGNTYSWLIDDVEFETSENANNQFNTAGSYKVKLISTSLNGCIDDNEIIIEITDSPTCQLPVSFGIVPVNDLCSGESTTLKANVVESTNPLNGYNYLWYEQGSIADVTDYSSTYSDLVLTDLTATITYVLRVEDGNSFDASCYSEQSVTININAIPVKPTVTNEDICKNSIAPLWTDLVIGTSLSWYDENKNSLVDSPTINTNLTASYGVSQTVLGCESDTSLITINVLENAQAIISGSLDNTSYCADVDNLTLDVMSNISTGKFVFTYGDLTGENETGEFTLLASDLIVNQEITAVFEPEGECFSISDPLKIIPDIRKISVPVLTLDQDSICADGQAQINLDVFGLSDDATNISWYKNGELQSEIGTSIVLTEPEQSGDYVIVVDHAVCDFALSLPVNVKIYEVPSMSMSSTPLILSYSEPQEVEVFVGLEGLEYDTLSEIDFENTTGGLRAQNYEYVNNDSLLLFPEVEGLINNYSLYIQTGEGNVECEFQIDFEINVTNEIYAPNLFTPNGDGENDDFVISGLELIPDANVYIYNRWGGIVHSVKDYSDNKWTGEGMPEGAYFYLIELPNDKGSYSGVIHILR